MRASEFKRWLWLMKEGRGWTQAECARQLGCSQNSITTWKENGAPAYIGLACAAIVKELGPGDALSA